MPHESITAPHHCRWLKFKDVPQTPRSNWTEVVCVRVERRQRMVVPALDCVGCRYWESKLNAGAAGVLHGDSAMQTPPASEGTFHTRRR